MNKSTSSSIESLIKKEHLRQENTLMLIPSENYASENVRHAVGSVLMNKYSEGYPKARYYQGNNIIDDIEIKAKKLAMELFSVPHVNVQPYSGSPANSAIFFALLEPKDTVMGLKLSGGGHLTHGHPDITFSGRYYTSVQYDVDENGLIDLDVVRKLAKKHKPKILTVGTTAYPRIFDWKKWRSIADEVGAYLHADISHIAGLVAGGAHPSPSKYADVIMTTTHKTLRGPRGAMIMVTDVGLSKDPDMGKRIDRAVFPGLQGGPHNNTTAGIAVALEEALKSDFSTYAKNVVSNAHAMAEELKKNNIKLVTDGTDNHLIVVDLTPQKVVGNVVAEALEVAGIVVNRNSIPHDPNPPFYPSGIRIGTPGVTTRGMKEKEMIMIAQWISEVVEHVKHFKLPEDKSKRKDFMLQVKREVQSDKKLLNIADKVKDLNSSFPAP